MRRWLSLAILMSMVVVATGIWYSSRPWTGTNIGGKTLTRQTVRANVKDDGDAEASEVIEPLVVDRGAPVVAPSVPIVDVGPILRAQMMPGMQQPPRPDGVPGYQLRMPYADEPEILGVPFDPIQRILESQLEWLNIFEHLNDPAEESAPPVWNPHAYPHCPYSGVCPVTHPFRGLPRD